MLEAHQVPPRAEPTVLEPPPRRPAETAEPTVLSELPVEAVEPTVLNSLPSIPERTETGKDRLIGAKVGDYVVEARLGSGGMGVVYRGTHPVIGKAVAIKVLQREISRDPDHVRRLVSEARSVNAIRHRGIVDIFGFGELPDGRPYLVMELLDGVPLDQLVEHEAPLAPAAVIPLLLEVADALSAAHKVGVIHRDLKPSNVFMVTPQHGPRYVKLLDFGLAKQAEDPGGATPQTRASVMVGTPHYIAPEQARGESVSPATDLYSLGAMAFELLTRRPPFEGPSAIEIIYHHLKAQAPRPSSVVRGIPRALDQLVLRLMEKDPARRPSSAEEVRAELLAIQSSLGRPGAGRRMPVPALVAGVVAIAAAGLSAILFARGSAPVPAAPAQAPARAEVIPAAEPPAPAAEPPPPETPVAVTEVRPAEARARPDPKVVRAALERMAAVNSRLERVRSAWGRERARRPPQDVRIFDVALESVGKQVARGRAKDLDDATRGMDEFVASALSGKEP